MTERYRPIVTFDEDAVSVVFAHPLPSTESSAGHESMSEAETIFHVAQGEQLPLVLKAINAHAPGVINQLISDLVEYSDGETLEPDQTEILLYSISLLQQLVASNGQTESLSSN
ncbi:MAG: hypothetical protein M3Q81_01890 [bacterium]|nr:hypothetical protein [bacterium]